MRAARHVCWIVRCLRFADFTDTRYIIRGRTATHCLWNTAGYARVRVRSNHRVCPTDMVLYTVKRNRCLLSILPSRIKNRSTFWLTGWLWLLFQTRNQSSGSCNFHTASQCMAISSSMGNWWIYEYTKSWSGVTLQCAPDGNEIPFVYFPSRYYSRDRLRRCIRCLFVMVIFHHENHAPYYNGELNKDILNFFFVSISSVFSSCVSPVARTPLMWREHRHENFQWN